MPAYGTIQWKDGSGNLGSTRIANPKGSTELLALGAALQNFCNAKIVGIRVLDKPGTPVAPVDGDRPLFSDKSHVVMRNEDLDIVKVTLPAPRYGQADNNGLEKNTDGEYQVPAATATAVAAAMNTNTNNGTLTVISSGYKSKS